LPVSLPAADTARLRRRGFRLEYATLTWMVAEAAVAITAGLIAASIALVGFGLGSMIELISATIVILQLRGEITGQDRHTRAVRLIGVTFFALATYLAIDSIRDLATQARPGQSIPGLALTASALVVMPVLAVAKRRTRAGSGQSHPGRGLRRDRVLRPHLRCRAPRGRPERLARVVVGRPRRRAHHRRLAVKEGIECWEEEDEADR
jgi:hypothetical protein